eukprot:Nitzschia sp. Nitz4//scaffold52_size167869//13553//15247//NITZ4_002257-RA/size167869-processed-gene-0.120-mRNA-1//1//CDS//3329553978//9275//frame0
MSTSFHPDSQGDSSYATFEAKKAQELNARQADQIHWERNAAYRNQNYRHLYHQEGLIGKFSIRLLEATDLKRSYWSALAVGPVKLLGLSKAHGAVSSFVSFSFDPTARETAEIQTEFADSKPAARAPEAPPCFVSSVVPQSDCPVWTTATFELPLRKGALRDGQRIKLKIRVDEDSTAVENILPGVPSGGDSRMLGMGEVDMTSLCTGQIPETGEPQVGVLDVWVPIRLPDKLPREGDANLKSSPAKKSLDKLDLDSTISKPSGESPGETGRVRVLISYQPHGMEPQPHDTVALEVFARQDAQSASCRPVLPSKLPLQVVDVSGPWLLVEYPMASAGPDQKACLKVHRNAVFVIERKNLVDSTLNLALMPADFFLSTPLGHKTVDLLNPIVIAGKQLVMPALLSSKLVWMAVRTTVLASLTGVHAATSAFVNEGSSSLTQDDETNRRRGAGTGQMITLMAKCIGRSTDDTTAIGLFGLLVEHFGLSRKVIRTLDKVV